MADRAFVTSARHPDKTPAAGNQMLLKGAASTDHPILVT